MSRDGAVHISATLAESMNFVNRAIRKVGCVSNLFKMRPASVPAKNKRGALDGLSQS